MIRCGFCGVNCVLFCLPKGDGRTQGAAEKGRMRAGSVRGSGLSALPWCSIGRGAPVLSFSILIPISIRYGRSQSRTNSLP